MRHTGILTEIIQNLGAPVIDPEHALSNLEHIYKDKLLIVAGDVEQVAKYAEDLRLANPPTESAAVLDYIGNRALAVITTEQVEEAINTLYPDRFIEP